MQVTLHADKSPVLNKALINAGIKVRAIIPQEASLEETFIELTENQGGEDKK